MTCITANRLVIKQEHCRSNHCGCSFSIEEEQL
nr:MAG TPA: epoxyqueuosine reductase [Caudoviricetes sp.]